MPASYQRFRGETDPLALWLSENAVLKPGAEFKAKRLRAEFREWSKGMSFPIVSDNGIARRLKKLVGSFATIDRNNESWFVGLAPLAKDF